MVWLPGLGPPLSSARACDQQPVGIQVVRDDLPWRTLAAFPTYREAGPVWASSADDVYLAYVSSLDMEHSLLHFNGISWQSVELPRNYVNGIWGSGPTCSTTTIFPLNDN